MKIEISFNKEQEAALHKMVVNGGHSDVESLIKYRLFNETPKQREEPIDDLLAEAYRLASELEEGAETTLRGLFSSELWQDINHGQRKQLGKRFFQDHVAHGLEHLGRNTYGQSKYKKVKE